MVKKVISSFVVAGAAALSTVAFAPSANAINVDRGEAGIKEDEFNVYINHTEQQLGSGALSGLITAAIGGKDAGIITGAVGAWIGEHGTCPDHKSLKVEVRRLNGDMPLWMQPDMFHRDNSKKSFSCVD